MHGNNGIICFIVPENNGSQESARQMEEFVLNLQIEFEKHAHAVVAAGQKAYMKNRFEFYGIKTPQRREIQKLFLAKAYLPPKKDLEKITKFLWNKPQREYQYFAQELVRKYIRKTEPHDITLYEYMVVNKSWWDTVDFIAVHLIGEYFKKYPDSRGGMVDAWLASGNIWLQRSAILFQLNYKENLDTEYLSYVINSLPGSKEFFINKAIGWVLRNYSKTDPEWVREFVDRTELDKLSRREALRLMG